MARDIFIVFLISSRIFTNLCLEDLDQVLELDHPFFLYSYRIVLVQRQRIEHRVRTGWKTKWLAEDTAHYLLRSAHKHFSRRKRIGWNSRLCATWWIEFHFTIVLTCKFFANLLYFWEKFCLFMYLFTRNPICSCWWLNMSGTSL